MQSEITIRQQEFTAVAPGRLDVMGGIADYSGSLLLQMPIAEETKVKLVKREDGVFHAHTDADVHTKQFSLQLSDLDTNDLVMYGRQVKSRPGGDWAVYVIGCFRILEQEKGLQWSGAEIQVSSGVPAGKGVSSSAAIEVATMHAICKAYGIQLQPLELALLAQRVENHIVGAACGLMDQLSVNLGLKDHLLPIICQPHEVFDPIALPKQIRFVGLDSGVRHAISAASYGDVRTAAFMGYSIAMMRSNQRVEDKPFGGYLANISMDEFHKKYAPLIPHQMKGSEFLSEFGTHIDPVTTVDPSTIYFPLVCATHPVQENHRIKIFRELILNYSEHGVSMAEEAGKLMFGSHEGYNSVGLGEPITNKIVELVKLWGIGHGIVGARVSGGGAGGTVTMMLSNDEGNEIVNKIRDVMKKETGKTLQLFDNSSDGAHYRN